MKTYARIQDGIVAETLQTDRPIATLFHPGLSWVDISGRQGITEGWRFDGAQFAAPPVPPAPAALPSIAEVMSELATLRAEVAALKAEVAPATKRS
jgi:hypothetical protein